MEWLGIQDKGSAACVHVDCASPLFQQPGQIFTRSPDNVTRLGNLHFAELCFKPGQIPLSPLNPDFHDAPAVKNLGGVPVGLETWRNTCRL